MIVGVIGAGQMGAGIAQVSAVAGHDVLLCDVALDRAQKGREGIARQLQRQAAKGALSAADAEAGEHAADESGQHGDEEIQHMSNRTPPNKISAPSARWSHFAGTF